MTTIRYVATPKSDFETMRGKRISLLWGDPVHVLEESDGRVHGYAFGYKGWIAAGNLCERSLLELYFIDVGQGDGILIKTPDGQWHLVDAGVANEKQMTRKGVANFLRWKFQDDLQQRTVTLANVILSHPDGDHFGGLLDVFAGKVYSAKLGDYRPFGIEVGNFYHNGIGRFAASPVLGASAAGQTPEFPQGSHGISRKGTFITELLDGQDSFCHPARPFKADFAKFAAEVGRVPHNVHRLTNQDRYLPGYALGENPVTINVLGPILECFDDGQSGLRVFGDTSHTVNGHSIVLRLDYGQARILLTGDLNADSQRLLLSYYPPAELLADVVKGAHHGAEEIEFRFLQAVQAKATVISSGDNEGYDHPRPAFLGAVGRYGRDIMDAEGKPLPPLVYSTELARSVTLAYAERVRVKTDAEATSGFSEADPQQVEVQTDKDRSAKRYRRLQDAPLAADLIYGLVNIRTDGESILCATRSEKHNDYDVKIFKAGM